jgi:WD40 repeat protein
MSGRKSHKQRKAPRNALVSIKSSRIHRTGQSQGEEPRFFTPLPSRPLFLSVHGSREVAETTFFLLCSTYKVVHKYKLNLKCWISNICFWKPDKFFFWAPRGRKGEEGEGDGKGPGFGLNFFEIQEGERISFVCREEASVPGDEVNSLAFVPPSKIALGSPHRITILTLTTDAQKPSIQQNSAFFVPCDEICDLTVLPNNHLVHRWNGDCLVWNLEDIRAEPNYSLRGGAFINNMLADHKKLVTVDYSGMIIIWDSENFWNLQHYDMRPSKGTANCIFALSPTIYFVQSSKGLIFFELETSKVFGEIHKKIYIDASCLLPTGDFAYSSALGIFVYSITSLKWKLGGPLLLGEGDKESIFYRVPYDVIFHILNLPWEFFLPPPK